MALENINLHTVSVCIITSYYLGFNFKFDTCHKKTKKKQALISLRYIDESHTNTFG